MTVTPQALGSLIKRTGIMKSQSKKGNSYNYHTEGYTLTRQYGKRYTFEYWGRLQLSILSPSQQDALNERRREALSTVLRVLSEKGISTRLEGTTLWIILEDN
jgi:diphthamide synthase (EF-2-diphthine--ammonia ligase)